MAEAPKGPAPQRPPTTPTTPTSSPSPAAPRASSGEFRVQSAARMQPVKSAALPQGPLSARLKEGATDTALNVVGILRDLWSDFRSSDQFFKYKALILASWVALSVASLFVACPGPQGPANTIGARLVQTKIVDTPVIMIVNDSGEAWEDVVVVVNHTFRAAVARVGAEPPDNNVTLEPKKLLGEGGQPAPQNLKITDLQVRTSSGRADLVAQGRTIE